MLPKDTLEMVGAHLEPFQTLGVKWEISDSPILIQVVSLHRVELTEASSSPSSKLFQKGAPKVPKRLPNDLFTKVSSFLCFSTLRRSVSIIWYKQFLFLFKFLSHVYSNLMWILSNNITIIGFLSIETLFKVSIRTMSAT